MNCSEIFIYIRSSLCLSQRAMGDMVGVTGKAWSHYEVGIRSPSIATAKKIISVARSLKVLPLNSSSPEDWKLEDVLGYD